ncbi:MAG: thioredoxin domain-containing protein [Verrucomicrobiota bacterium JB023]|nr:thioredoxin domain-containing protein [Verrucomicrobiota bacterium JB023]
MLRLLFLFLTTVLLLACDQVGEKEAPEDFESVSADGLPVVTSFRTLSSRQFRALLAKEDRIVVVEFYADWCGPCRKLASVLEDYAAEGTPGVQIAKVNVEKESGLARRYEVRSIPDTRIFFKGREIGRFVGALGKAEVEKRITAAVREARPKPSQPSHPQGSSEPSESLRKQENDLPPGIQRL